MTEVRNERDSEKILDEKLEKAMGRVAITLWNNIKKLTPVKTSNLINNINYESDNREARVGTNVFYAKFVEYGTYKMRPRAMFRTGLANSRGSIEKIMAEELK